MLKPIHFRNLQSNFEREGIQFDISIVEHHRKSRLFRAVSKRSLRSLNAPTRIRVNPIKPTIAKLFSEMRAMQESENPNEPINIIYGAPKRYQRKMKWAEQGYGKEGRQDLIVVASSGNQVVGYTTINVSVIYDSTEVFFRG
ncbi:hypothetical protein C4565_10380 [Candidatus Parcubacteria bacterium]|nr:MAG: hypothetical protein C4565_10380 [Candidatus Parcubacteria bacterium]